MKFRPAALIPQEIFLVFISLEAYSTSGHSVAGRNMSMKNSNDIIGSPTRDLPACSALPQPTVPLRTACYCVITDIFPDLYISKQPHSLFTEFRATSGVCLSVYFPLNLFAFGNDITVSFIANNSEGVVALKVKCAIVC